MKSTFKLLFLITMLCASPHAYAADTVTDAQILHLLNRISFGPAPGDIDRVRSIGIGAYIEQQLHPSTLTPPTELTDRLHDIPIIAETLPEIIAQYQPTPGVKLDGDQQKTLNQNLGQLGKQLSQAKILCAIMNPAQLQEVMTDFWFNHFNVFREKDLDRVFITTYERDAIRPYALGKFRDLLGATAHHPAMLIYLDNWQNTDPNSPAGIIAAQHGRDLGINENYAREIMELHTLGLDGGYSQQDVTTLAHVLTGWGIGKGKEWASRSVFYFDPQRHDYNTKLFLGQTLSGGGENEVENTLDILARSPATAHHIAYQLAQYFVADEPPASLVDKLATSYRASDGDIASVLRTLFQSPEFWDPQYAQNKFKPPLRYVISSFRVLGAVPQGDTGILQNIIADMGEPLYRCLTPNGYANTNDQWLNSDALLKRINIAQKLSSFFNAQAFTTVASTIGNNWSAKTQSAVNAADPKLRPAMLLSSPEFLYY